MIEAKATRIPNFISAASPMGLRRLMLRTNNKFGQQINYFSIQNVDGNWFAWFYSDIQNDDSIFNKANQKEKTEGVE